MSSSQPPDGWDVPTDETMAMARAFRQMFVSFIAAGFTSSESAMIIGAMMAAAGNTQSSTPPAPS